MPFQNDDQRKAVMSQLNSGHGPNSSSVSLAKRFPAAAQAHNVNQMLQTSPGLVKWNNELRLFADDQYDKDWDMISEKTKEQLEKKFVTDKLSEIYQYPMTDDNKINPNVLDFSKLFKARYGWDLIEEKYLKNTMNLESFLIRKAIQESVEKYSSNLPYGHYKLPGDSDKIKRLHDDVDFSVEWKARDIELDRAIENLPESLLKKTWDGISEGVKRHMFEMTNGYRDRGYPSSAASSSFEHVSKRSIVDAFNSEIKSRIDHPKNYRGHDALDDIIPVLKPSYEKWKHKITNNHG